MTECLPHDRQVVYTSQFDPALSFVGGSPFVGDIASTGIVLPATPTPDQVSRYLCRLCAASVAPNTRCIVRSIRQYLSIIGRVTGEHGVPAWDFELPVRTPLWRFVDGNVSWHLRRVTEREPEELATDVILGFPYSRTRRGLTAAILGRIAAPGYIPLNAGIPYGQDLGSLGNFYDIRFPWEDFDQSDDLGIEVVGPCDLVLYASVYQTDPATRPPFPGSDDLRNKLVEVVAPEDAFLLRLANARYHRIAGAMLLDFCNLEIKDTSGDCVR